MTLEERMMALEHENEKLKARIQEHEGKAINRAFAKLRQLRLSVQYDGTTSIRAFNTIADCLETLKDRYDEETDSEGD